MPDSADHVAAGQAVNVTAPFDFDVTTGYRTDDREISFFLWELMQVEEKFLGKAPSKGVDRAKVEAFLADARRHAYRLATASEDGDRNPAHLLPDGTVAIPDSYYPLWEEHKRDWFWLRQHGDDLSLTDDADRYPHPVMQMVSEMFTGANASFMTYAGFTPSAANLIRVRGTETQKRLFVDKLKSVTWDACFCATEPDAGSDLGAVQTLADPIEGEIYSIQGEKKYITAGMHPLTENTVYIVLGRMRGTGSALSLSCFVVPRFWVEEDGSLTPNHVDCAVVEDKMGLNGCANTHLVFGKSGTTRGYLLGNRPNLALYQLVNLMRKARIGTGQIATAIASSAYLHSLEYARHRIQGSRFDQSSVPNAPRVRIIEHLDVQRMLLEMKAKVEGCRAVIGKISGHSAMIQKISRIEPIDEATARRHGRLAMLYAPIAKAYISEQAWQIVTLAIQVHGAVGYLRNRPLEQYARDLKILTIWEGTNFIQSQDLVRDKLGFGRESVSIKDFSDDVRASIDAAKAFPELSRDADSLAAALEALLAALETIRQLSDNGEMMRISQFCTRFLQMFGEVMMAWCLLDAARVSAKALSQLPDGHPDHAFYRGKIKTSHFFHENILPNVAAQAAVLADNEQATVAMEDAEFGYRAPSAQQPSA